MYHILHLRLHLNRLFLQKSNAVQKTVFFSFFLILSGVVFGIGTFSYHSFRFLYTTDGGGLELVLYALSIGLALLLMLFVLGSFVTYISLAYSAQDLSFFFSLPVHPRQIALEKLAENMLISGWAVVLLGMPLMVGLGLVLHAGMGFYVVALIMLALLCVVSASLGSALAAFCYRFLALWPRWSVCLLSVVAVYASARLLAFVALPDISRIDSVISSGAPFALNTVTRPLTHSLPSYEMSLLVGSTLGRSIEIASVWWLVFGVSLVVLLSVFVIDRLYVKGWQEAQSFHSETSVISATTLFANGQYVWEKREFLQLWRDLRTGGQLGFVGVLGILCFLVLGFVHSFHDVPREWQGFIVASLLSIFGYVLATFALRFVFPSMSLESKSSWFAWSSPVALERLIQAKWVVNISLMVLVALVLALLSAALLPYGGSERALVVTHIFLLAVMIGAIHLGLGLTYPNFHESDPGSLSTTGPGLAAVVLSLGLVALDAFVISRDASAMENGTMVPALLHLILWAGATVVLTTGWMRRSYEAAKTYTF